MATNVSGTGETSTLSSISSTASPSLFLAPNWVWQWLMTSTTAKPRFLMACSMSWSSRLAWYTVPRPTMAAPAVTAISLMEKACSTWPYIEVADLAP